MMDTKLFMEDRVSVNNFITDIDSPAGFKNSMDLWGSGYGGFMGNGDLFSYVKPSPDLSVLRWDP